MTRRGRPDRRLPGAGPSITGNGRAAIDQNAVPPPQRGRAAARAPGKRISRATARRRRAEKNGRGAPDGFSRSTGDRPRRGTSSDWATATRHSTAVAGDDRPGRGPASPTARMDIPDRPFRPGNPNTTPGPTNRTRRSEGSRSAAPRGEPTASKSWLAVVGPSPSSVHILPAIPESHAIKRTSRTGPVVRHCTLRAARPAPHGDRSRRHGRLSSVTAASTAAGASRDGGPSYQQTAGCRHAQNKTTARGIGRDGSPATAIYLAFVFVRTMPHHLASKPARAGRSAKASAIPPTCDEVLAP